MLKSVHYFTVEYSLPGDYDYKRQASLNLNKVFKNEEELVEAIKLLLFDIDEITRNCSLENYKHGILLLNDNNLTGEFSLINKDDEYYNSLTLYINVNLGLYDYENDMLFKSELVYLNN